MEREPLRTGGELEEIIRRYQSMVYGLALARTGSPADADDVFQETFLPITGREKSSGRRSTARRGFSEPP